MFLEKINSDVVASINACTHQIDIHHHTHHRRTIHHMNAYPVTRLATALLLAVTCGVAHANAPLTGQATRAEEQYARLLGAHPGSRTITLASKAPASTRSSKPLAVAGVAPGQTGYVHYFLLRMPDESLEVQVGIELADQRIAWSFPDLGVVISPFLDGESMQAGDKSYEVWHLYGIRPHADTAAMARLEKELPARVARWVKAGIPYCLDDTPGANCMSCLGLVMRALFPGRSDYPALPRNFWRAGMGSRYTPDDLLLYLTGMLDLPDRNTRLQRINRLALPPDLRLDLEDLVYSMGTDAAPPREALQKRKAVPQKSQRKL